jgi:hypothetical protein
LTFRPGEAAPRDGFMVALPATRGMAGAVSWAGGETGVAGAEPAVAAWVRRVLPVVLAGRDLWIGAWVDGGTLYLDVSERIAAREVAARVGRERDQIAVWDLGRGEAVPTGGTGAIDGEGRRAA